MTRPQTALVHALTILAMAAPIGAQPAADVPVAVEVRGGTATFDAETSVSAISVHGTSTALQGKAQVRSGAGGLVIESLDATVPVQSVTTGMGLRDEHMRRYIFTTTDGKVPDLHFRSDRAACAPAAQGPVTCKLTGAMAIRGAERPFVMDLKVARAGTSYRAVGDTMLKLSTWGIERPSQFGVTTEDAVRLHLEFVAQPAVEATAANQGGR